MKKVLTFTMMTTLVFVFAAGISSTANAGFFTNKKAPKEDVQDKAMEALLNMDASTLIEEATEDAVDALPVETSPVIPEEAAVMDGVLEGTATDEMDTMDEVVTEELNAGAGAMVGDVNIAVGAPVENIQETTDELTDSVDHSTMDHSQHMMGTIPADAARNQGQEKVEVETQAAVVEKTDDAINVGASVETVKAQPALARTPPKPIAGAATSQAVITGTEAGSVISGVITLTETAEGLWLTGDFQNVPNPGNHGIHIHDVGSCADAGKGAGDHFNPAGSGHGHLAEHGHSHAHAGDMGNIQVKQDGSARLDVVLADVGLRKGKYLVDGKSIILHANPDDFGQPTGNAGARIGCGIIGGAKVSE
jgi:Cu-Zn family superoxide dismutase